MIKSITVTNYLGESMTMELTRPEKSGFIVQSVTGLGPGKATVNTTEVSTSDGGFYNSSRLATRNIVLTLGFLPLNTIEDTRQLSYRLFPIKKKLTLTFDTDNRHASIDGYVESNEPTIFSKEESTTISILCPDPYFYSDGDDGEQETSFYGIEPLFEFPFSNESLDAPLIVFDRTTINDEKIVTYAGDTETGIVIRIHAVGKAGNITIYNVGTQESMGLNITDFVTGGIQPGDDIVVSTVRGQKSAYLIRNGSATNILRCLSRDSSWFKVSKGDNRFAYSADSGWQNLQFRVEHRTLYEGI